MVPRNPSASVTAPVMRRPDGDKTVLARPASSRPSSLRSRGPSLESLAPIPVT